MSDPDPEDLLVVADRLIAVDGESAAGLAPVAIRIAGGRIAAIGPPSALRTSGVRVLNAAGATITAGLTDAHIHLTEWALARQDVDLSVCRSAQEAAHALTRARRPDATGAWIRGRGWDRNRWDGPPPHRNLLDAHFPERPVVLQSHDMHALWLNSAGLSLAAIDEHTPDPDGGRIVRDPDGRPTGVLLETACEAVTRVLPRRTPAETTAAVLDGQTLLHRFGITGVHVLPSIHLPEPDPLAPLEAVRATGRLRLRVLQHLPLRALDEAIRSGLYSGLGDEWITIGGVKMFLDGTLGSRTAWLEAPYPDEPGYRGVAVIDPDEFRFCAERAAAAGLTTTVHAIGDAAVALALETLADPALALPAMPHRIEHVQCCPERHLRTPGPARITCSMQPAHLITDWRVADRHWGADRSSRTYAFRSLLDSGALLAFGSDAPVEPVDPRLGLFAAVARRDTDGQPRSGWFPRERLTIQEAFRGYTRGPALAAGQSHAGRVAVGSPADLALWNRNPLEGGADALLTLHCVAAMVAGEMVHS